MIKIWDKMKNLKFPLGLAIIIASLAIYKFHFLFLPYYWDEAWPYSTAVHLLYNHGLSFLPSSIPSEISRGHPLMFFFLAATWMKIFGTGLFSGHCFALLISTTLLIIIFLFCRRFFSERVGFIACLLFATQAVFIAQSVFLMPEVLMALWTTVCFYAYFNESKLLYIVGATAMLLTKESGGMLIVALCCYELLQFAFSTERQYKLLFKKMILVFTPVGFALIYFIIQKIEYGWFLFPFYMKYLSSKWDSFSVNLPSGAAYLFIYFGRNGLTIFVIIALAAIAKSKKTYFSLDQKKIISALSLYIILYLLFSSVNYYIPRYLLCALPPFIIVGSVLIEKVFSRFKFVYPIIIAGLAATFIFYYANTTNYGDMDYTPSVTADLKIVSFCEQHQLYDSSIYATTVLRIDFTDSCAGYLTGKQFKNIQSDFSDKTRYCIISNDEPDDDVYNLVKNNSQYRMIKRTQESNKWREIYELKQ
jgi:4-amino-4-deoxy-L-arabinose transferase-like glycosyltransferase